MGVEIEMIEPGDGKTFAKKGDTVVVHYTGTLKNGKKFDSSFDRNAPFKCKIGLGRVIKGWDESFTKLLIKHNNVLVYTGDSVLWSRGSAWGFVAKISKGGKAKLTVSPDFAYGAKGIPGVVGPNATLIFDVELLDVICE